MISRHVFIVAVDDPTSLCWAISISGPGFISHRISISEAVGLSVHPPPAPACVWALEPRQVSGSLRLTGSMPGGMDEQGRAHGENQVWRKTRV